MTFSESVNHFNENLHLDVSLPKGIIEMNPFRDNPEVLKISSRFYNKFYNDGNPRKMIVGINPGRLGAGQTGIPFTDSKRLAEVCGIDIESVQTHEPSSVFVYEVIKSYGGPEKFYNDFYINSVCPLGFLEKNSRGNWVNCNYYDYPELFDAVKDFCVQSLKTQISFGIDTSVCYVLGKKNAKFFEILNKEHHLFNDVVQLYHPRYIIQYKSKNMFDFVNNFIEKLE